MLAGSRSRAALLDALEAERFDPTAADQLLDDPVGSVHAFTQLVRRCVPVVHAHEDALVAPLTDHAERARRLLAETSLDDVAAQLFPHWHLRDLAAFESVALIPSRAIAPFLSTRLVSGDKAVTVFPVTPDTQATLESVVALVVLGRKAETQLGYTRALPTLEELAAHTGESVNLGIRAGSDVLVVLDVASTQPLRFQQVPGTRVPVHTSAMGKSLLAYTPDPAREVEDLLPLAPVTDRTITAQTDLVTELERTRTRGWALNDGERDQGVRAIAAPVLDPDGWAIAAVAVQGPALRLTDDRLGALALPLARAAGALSPLLTATSPP